MRFDRRAFMSSGALAAVGAALPMPEAAALTIEPLSEQDDMVRVLGSMEQHIAKLRERIAESEAAPFRSASEVRHDALALHHRAQILTRRTEALHKLALNETLAEQRAIQEERTRRQLAVWNETHERIWKIIQMSKALSGGEVAPDEQESHIRELEEECYALSDDYAALFLAVLRTPAKPV